MVATVRGKGSSIVFPQGSKLGGGQVCRQEVVHGERAHHLSQDIGCWPSTPKHVAWQQQSP